MRYAIFTDVHANLEALEAVLARIDELAQEEPIDQIWFLGDLVGYGPNPNECIAKLRERTNVIIAGNHDWAAVGKLDLEDFSEAARISALWTAEHLTKEHREFLAALPERLEIDECLLVHGSPYGPLWEYLTSEVLAERSFQYFNNHYCFVGHTHVPIIFQQPDTVANTPTIPLDPNNLSAILGEESEEEAPSAEAQKSLEETHAEETPATQIVALREAIQMVQEANESETPHSEETLQNIVADVVDTVTGIQQQIADDSQKIDPVAVDASQDAPIATEEDSNQDTTTETSEVTPEETITNAEERLNEEIEELLALLGLSQSMIHVTNEMIVPPEGTWEAPDEYRAIVNPGGVGQPRDGDARAAFMIYDTDAGFTFYRIPYAFEKTQEKIIKARLPQYLATRLAYGR